MKPRSVTCTPHSARSMFSVFTARPAAISTVATSIFCVAPPASTSRVTFSFPGAEVKNRAPGKDKVALEGEGGRGAEKGEAAGGGVGGGGAGGTEKRGAARGGARG